MPNRLLKSVAALAAAAGILVGATTSAYADRGGWKDGPRDHRHDSGRYDRDRHDDRRGHDRDHRKRWDHREYRHDDRRVVVPNGHWRRGNGRVVVLRPVVKPHRHRHPGYGWYRTDDDAYKWLSFAAITLKLLDTLDDAAQRAHENAQIAAAQARVGDTIRWNERGASGAVTVLRDGWSSTGRYCREFQQTVTIGGRTEQAFGTACQQPDGAWEIVSTDD
ncbi:MAG: hypothetical protein CMM50_15910 [Rhodospirillaceae bacterium]|nr:hypothetical protein [Rhodospirillaceae bacterium]